MMASHSTVLNLHAGLVLLAALNGEVATWSDEFSDLREPLVFACELKRGPSSDGLQAHDCIRYQVLSAAETGELLDILKDRSAFTQKPSGEIVERSFEYGGWHIDPPTVVPEEPGEFGFCLTEASRSREIKFHVLAGVVTPPRCVVPSSELYLSVDGVGRLYRLCRTIFPFRPNTTAAGGR